MVRTSLSSAALVVLLSAWNGCAENPPANTASATPAPSTTASSSGMMGGHGMSGPGMMDGGQGMMAGHGMMGGGMMDGGEGMMGGQGMTGGAMMDGGQGMMGGHAMMGGGMMDMMGMGDQCPMLLPGTTVQPKDMKDGMAMTFTTKGDVAELRRRVRVMADRMNAHASGSAGGMGMHGGMMGGADAGMSMMGGTMMGGTVPAMRAQVEDVDRGARLKMTPVDPSKLNDMREHMKRQVQMMNRSHGCSTVVDGGSP